METASSTERYIQCFVDVARQQLRAHPWEEIEPALSISWEELREPGTPPWQAVSAEILARCLDGGGTDRAA